MMTYTETLQYMFTRLPMYQRIGEAAYKADLTNTRLLCELLGNPHQKFKTIHVAGTNGKGSTSHILASIFQEAGFKTGLYTSPHYKDFRERIKINGQMIPRESVVAFIEKHKNQFEEIGLSFFEMTVGMAFEYFADQEIDIAIIETGLGGRLDSTNVITPLLAAITNIGYDHMHFLGNSLELIAREKAGIMKENIPVVIGQTQEEVQEIFLNKADELDAPISFADMHWNIEQKPSSHDEITISNSDEEPMNVRYPLLGNYQHDNLKTALEIIYQLNSTQTIIPKDAIRKGIQNVLSNTGLQGRWQTLSTNPLVICDSGHNHEGIAKALENINLTPHKNLHIVFGMVNDKDISNILNLLPGHASYYFCKANIPRGLNAKSLQEQAAEIPLKGDAYDSVNQALTAARKNATAEDLIFVGGSIFVVAEVL